MKPAKERNNSDGRRIMSTLAEAQLGAILNKVNAGKLSPKAGAEQIHASRYLWSSAPIRSENSSCIYFPRRCVVIGPPRRHLFDRDTTNTMVYAIGLGRHGRGPYLGDQRHVRTNNVGQTAVLIGIVAIGGYFIWQEIDSRGDERRRDKFEED